MPDPTPISVINPIRINPGLFRFLLRSQWAFEPISLNKPLNDGSWEDAGTMKFDKT